MPNIFILLFKWLLPAIYAYQVTTTEGTSIPLGNFEGKKILLVNTASRSPYVGQLGKLEQLYQQHKDSLVIIAFPSNSFGNEPLSNAQIRELATGTYDVHYILSEKVAVSGTDQAAVYHWLTQKTQNGMLDNPVHSDFYKFLINEQGMLIGVFAPSVDPLSEELQSVLRR